MKKNAGRFWIISAICAGTALLFLALYLRGWEPLQNLEYYTEDLRTRLGVKTPVDPQLVLIGIDRPFYDYGEDEIAADPDLRMLQRNFPWSRAVWAKLIQKLGDAGTKVIVLDLIFAGEGEGDEALKQALDKYRDQVVIGANIRDLKAEDGKDTLALNLPNASVLNSSSTNAAYDDRVGYVNIWPDPDEVERSARYRLDSAHSILLPDGAVIESLAARALRKFGRRDAIPPGFDAVRFRYTRAPGFGYKPIPIGDVMASNTWDKNFQKGAFFKNKIVLIGPTANIFQDAHATPFATIEKNGQVYSSGMLGPEIHLNIIGAALHGDFLRETGRGTNAMFIMLAGLVTMALCAFVRQPLWRLGAVLLAFVAYWYLGQLLYNRAALIIPIANPLLVLAISGVLVMSYDYLLEQFERARIRKTMERYVSKDIVKELLDNPETDFNALGGTRKKRVTVLFSDLRGFTTLTESSDEGQLVKQLNEYFEKMVLDVFGFKGTLDKFIGDAVMAVWGNIVTHGPEQDAQHAVATALSMRQSLARLNEDWKKRGMLQLAFGIGINHGEAIVGNMGSTEKMELTVIGDAVNTASRLEGLTKRYHLDLLLGEAVAPLVSGRFILRTVDYVQVKGKTKPTEVFTVAGEKGAGVDAQEQAWLADYEEGVRLYRQRSFEKALRKFEDCLLGKPGDYLSEMYQEQCRILIKNPPDENWNGVCVMTEK